jgi:hypothetical protein
VMLAITTRLYEYDVKHLLPWRCSKVVTAID